MPEVVLDVLKYFFLALIFLFLARAVKAMYLEIAGPRSSRAPKASTTIPRPRPGKPPEKLSVVPEGGKPKVYDITDELIIGRDEKCHVVIEDAYSSQVHARIFRRGDDLFLEDMGSTNGTYLNRRKVTGAIPVARGDRGRIGKTELEFKK